MEVLKLSREVDEALEVQEIGDRKQPGALFGLGTTPAGSTITTTVRV
jgi:hypothetical protein